MPERVNYLYTVNELARKTVLGGRASWLGPHIGISPTDIEITRNKILIWNKNQFWPHERLKNRKRYLLGIQCFEELLILTAAEDNLILSFGISDQEIRESFNRSIKFKLPFLVNRVQTVMKNHPQDYKERVLEIADWFSRLQDLQSSLFLTTSNLHKA